MAESKEPLRWLLWHPHQGLGNARLFGLVGTVIPAGRLRSWAFYTVVWLDTAVLLLRVVARRLALTGPTTLLTKARLPDSSRLVYLDLGTHAEGAELSIVVDRILPRICKHFEAHGFEASRDSFEQVARKFSGRPNVQILHKAVCRKLPAEGTIRIYRDSSSGLSNSLYRSTDSFEQVEAVRLSDYLVESGIDAGAQIVVLRMNIEGAESDVLEDLVDSGLAKHIDAYYGMWDDLSKIDPRRDDAFRSLLKRQGIRKLTFNGRDLTWPSRVRCIEYDMHTQILRAHRGSKRR